MNANKTKVAQITLFVSYEKNIVGIIDEKLLIKDKDIIAYTNKLVYGANEEIQLNLNKS